MNSTQAAKEFGANGGRARGKALTQSERTEASRYAAILRWYPTVDMYNELSKDPERKKKYLKMMKEIRKKKAHLFSPNR